MTAAVILVPMTPSPLPPEPTPTLELVNAKLTHLIVVAEVTSDRVNRWDERIERVVERERGLTKIAERLSAAALRQSLGFMPMNRWVGLALVSCSCGGLGAFLYELARASTAFAK